MLTDEKLMKKHLFLLKHFVNSFSGKVPYVLNKENCPMSISFFFFFFLDKSKPKRVSVLIRLFIDTKSN